MVEMGFVDHLYKLYPTVYVWGDEFERNIHLDIAPKQYLYTITFRDFHPTKYDQELLTSSDKEAKNLFIDMIVKEYQDVYMNIKINIK